MEDMGLERSAMNGTPMVLTADQLVSFPELGSDVAVDSIRIEHGLISGFGTAEDAALLRGADHYRLAGHTILPGLIDAHMHFFGVPGDENGQLRFESVPFRALRAAAEARRMLMAGITSARCMGSNISPDLSRAIAAGLVSGPRLISAGDFICSTGGTWDKSEVPHSWALSQGMIADGVDECRRIVRTRIREGATVIKIGLSKGPVTARYRSWGEDPRVQASVYSMPEVTAITEEAHENGLKVSAHCIGDAAVRKALDGGVDIIEHGFGITAETRSRVVEQHKRIVSTLSHPHLHLQTAREQGYPPWKIELYERHMAVMLEDFALGLEAGVDYALGTDNVGFPTHPQDNLALEFELAVSAGMSSSQALFAGTRTNADVIGMADTVGSLEVGKYADLVVVEGDPRKDIRKLRDVVFVMQGGIVVRDRVRSVEADALPAS